MVSSIYFLCLTIDGDLHFDGINRSRCPYEQKEYGSSRPSTGPPHLPAPG
jgi:hypothetical protein